MAKLTDKQISGLRPRAVRYEVWDGDGLGVRVTPKGTRTFVLVYHFGDVHRPRRLTLGRFRSSEDMKSGIAADGAKLLTLTQARRAAQDARHQIERGIDPGTIKQEEKAAERKAETIDDLAADFIRLYSKAPIGAEKKPRKKTWKEDERILQVNVVAKWRGRKAKDIGRTDVIRLLDGITARPAPIMANRTLAVLTKMFRWAIPRNIVSADPTYLVQKPGKEVRRERALRADEIKSFWRGIDVMPSVTIRLALKLSLVTAQRRSEITGIVPGEIDDVGALWTIPGARTKNGKPHAVPLSALALEIIRQARIEAAKFEGCDPSQITYLFPDISRDGRFRSLSPTKVTVALIAVAPSILGKPLSPHDLRRSAHSLMAAEGLGVPRFIRDKVINHTDRTPGRHYDVYEYLAEKRSALNAWGNYVSTLIDREGGNVVAIGAGQQ